MPTASVSSYSFSRIVAEEVFLLCVSTFDRCVKWLGNPGPQKAEASDRAGSCPRFLRYGRHTGLKTTRDLAQSDLLRLTIEDAGQLHGVFRILGCQHEGCQQGCQVARLGEGTTCLPPEVETDSAAEHLDGPPSPCGWTILHWPNRMRRALPMTASDLQHSAPQRLPQRPRPWPHKLLFLMILLFHL